MIVKVVRDMEAFGRGGHKNQEVFDVKKYAIQYDLDDLDGSPMMRLQLDGDELVLTETYSATVYIMNSSGETIDKIRWDPDSVLKE